MLGLCGLLVSWFTFAIPSILAVIFGAVGISQTGRGQDRRDGRGMAVAGVALGAAVTIATFLVWGSFWGGVSDAVDEAKTSVAASPSFNPDLGYGQEETTEPAAPTYTPTPKDFSITLRIKEKACFGSAGCNVTYVPELTVVGSQVDQAGSYEITYEVRGGDDGATIDTIEVDAGEYQQTEGLAQTATKSTRLTAVITDISVG